MTHNTNKFCGMSSISSILKNSMDLSVAILEINVDEMEILRDHFSSRRTLPGNYLTSLLLLRSKKKVSDDRQKAKTGNKLTPQ